MSRFGPYITSSMSAKAARKTPLTMAGYLNARMIRDPLCMLDMDIPVDGADAFVLTTTEKARAMKRDPVVVHAATAGMVGKNDEDQLPDLSHHGQHVVVEALKERSDVWIDDIDVFFPYDGFSIITLGWIENVGYAKPGQAGRFMQEHWDDELGCVMIDGRVPMNPHGGSLSEGASRGTGHLREAVTQLRGEAGDRMRRLLLQLPGRDPEATLSVGRVEYVGSNRAGKERGRGLANASRRRV